MMTAEMILEAFRQLPATEQKQVAARIARVVRKAKSKDPEKAKAEFMSLAGSVNTGEVYIPCPDREMLYEDR